MLQIDDQRTIGEAWDAAVTGHGGRPFLVIPSNPARDYLPAGAEITYAEAGAEVKRLAEAWSRAGYGSGHRVAAHAAQTGRTGLRRSGNSSCLDSA